MKWHKEPFELSSEVFVDEEFDAFDEGPLSHYTALAQESVGDKEI